MGFFGILALTLAVSPLFASAARHHPGGAPRGLLSEWPRDFEGHHAVHRNPPRHGTLSPDLGATAALPTPASMGAPEEMHDPGDLASLASVPLLGGYTHVDGDGTGALDAGRYAMLKLNCARLLADPPCAPLDRAHILDAVSHITSVDYWFLNISTGAVPPRTLHFTVAVDDLSESRARDFDCPSLDRGEMAMYNLVRATENGADVTNPCSFEPHPDASASLGASMPRVTGEKKARVAWRPWDAPAVPLRADVLKNVTNQGTGSDLGASQMAGSLKADGSSSKADGSSSKADGLSKADRSSAKECVCDAEPVSNRIEQQRWLMYQIETFGPVTAVMSAASFPHGGDPTRVHSCDGPCDTVDHAVVIVGWGVSSVEDGEEPYWIVQNSWTDKWKDGGRVKIKRGSNTCCIEDRWMKIDPDFSETYDPDDFSDQPACANGGTIDRATNKCECPFPWSNGPESEVAREGCEVCGILECANGGELDAHSCACACPVGYGGLTCDSAFFASSEMTKAGCTIYATLESDDAQIEEDIVIAVKIGENKNWIPLTHLGELCDVGEAGSKLGMSELDSWLKASVWGAGLKADESSAKYNGTYTKGSCTKGSVNATLDLAARNIHPHPNEEIFVRFVRDLGVNEFGVARGYDFAFFGDAAEASAGTCSPSPAQRVASALGFTRESARGEVASKKNGLVITTASFAVLAIAFAALKAASKGKSAVKKGYNSDMNSLVSGEAQPLLRRAS